MEKRLRVDAEDLHLRAARLDVAADSVASEHDAAHSSVAGVVPKLGGSASGAAMADLLGTWEEETRKHHRAITGLATDHRTAATQYLTGDSDGKRRIDATDSEL